MEQPLVQFVRMIPEGRPPKRADRSAAGFLPARAMRYCDALTSATGYGYWIFPPTDIRLIWDGERVFWSHGEVDSWLPLSETDSGAVQFPGYAETFDSIAPEHLRGYSPPFLTALPEQGGVQIWSGLLAKTRPGWSLFIRPPINLPPAPGLAGWEGIVETDLWIGPLFSNFRLTRTNEPVQIRASAPFMQVLPVPQLAYSDQTLASMTVLNSDAMEHGDWDRLGKVLLPDDDHEARQGLYAVTVRKRRLCPVHTVETALKVATDTTSKN